MINATKLVWTKHAEYKMRHYRLSESRVKRVLRNPLRIEDGIAEDTIAMMQKAGTVKNPYEIWVMVVRSNVKGQGSNVRVISAWRYPGVTKPGEPLPKEIIRELKEAI